jgi:hypothetical protein
MAKERGQAENEESACSLFLSFDVVNVRENKPDSLR